MTKKIRLALMVCLTLCLTVFAAAFAACGNGETGFDGKYTFKLVDEANKPVEGVSLQFCVGDSCRPGTTDENGIFEIECDEPVEAHVQMLNAGDSGLSFEDFYTTKTQFEYTIVMK